LEDVLSEKMLFGDLKAGEIVLVDVSDETDAATFTFKGTAKADLPDTPGDLAEANN
jgi:ATP-dependent Clp protease ATP-binding subunit ClpC